MFGAGFACSQAIQATSVLDLRYKPTEFAELTVSFSGYLPAGDSLNLYVYMSSETAYRQDKAYAVAILESTDTLKTVRRSCKAGYVHVIGMFIVEGDDMEGYIVPDLITEYEGSSDAGPRICWDRREN